MKVEVERYLSKMIEREVIRLGLKYGFDISSELKEVKIEVKCSSVERSKIVLPFCGVMQDKNCEGLRLNHGLYTQCTNEKKEGILCETCKKQTEKNSNGKPTYGYISERISKGSDFKDPKGKAPVLYGNIMEKLNISREEAIKEAEKQGLTIPEEQFEVKKAQRGRPKKDTTAVDTDEEEQPKKTRGRPKKDKQTVTANTGEDIIKSLVQQAQIGGALDTLPPLTPQATLPVASLEVTKSRSPEIERPSQINTNEVDDGASSSEDEEELAVSEFKIDGKKYLKAADDTLYDFKTHEEIGTWNASLKQIE